MIEGNVDPSRNDLTLYFNSEHLPQPELEYVAWVDIMGIQAVMSRSISVSANFVFKLHASALQAPRESVVLYPVMDGFYAASSRMDNMLRFLTSVFQSVADEFIAENAERHKFIVRGSLAYGPIIHGSRVEEEASRELHAESSYRASILLGLPMIQVHNSEPLAPPFGIYIHESARSYSQTPSRPLNFAWWWWDNPRSERWRNLKSALEDYYSWCADRTEAIEYKLDRLKTHRTMMKQYFVEVDALDAD